MAKSAKVHATTRIWEKTADILNILNYNKLLIETKTDFMRLAIEEKLAGLGITEIDHVFELGLNKDKIIGE